MKSDRIAAGLSAILVVALLLLVCVVAPKLANDDAVKVRVSITNECRYGSMSIYVDDMWLLEYWCEQDSTFNCSFTTTPGNHTVRAYHDYGWCQVKNVTAPGFVDFVFEN